MLTIDPASRRRLQSELSPGEDFYWAGRPNPKIIFHSEDLTLIPFSLLWLGFFVFWEGGALGKWGSPPDTFLTLWGIPFLLYGNYLVWGRFLYDAWAKRRTYYAVTNRRILIVREGWKPKAFTMYLEWVPSMEREGEPGGTLWLGPRLPVMGPRGSKKRDMSRFAVGEVPLFADIDDVLAVQKLVLELKARLKTPLRIDNPLSYPPSI